MKAQTLIPAFVAWLGVNVLRVAAAESLPKPADMRVDFARDIKPILERSCLQCHGPVKPKSGHRVDTREAIIKGGDSDEAALVPGNSGKSPLVQYVADLVPDMEMPPLDNREKYPALTPPEIALVRAWIDQGVSWPEGIALSDTRKTGLDRSVTAQAGGKDQPMLFTHIRHGDTAAIQASLSDRSLLDQRDEAGNTPLIQAAFYLDPTQLRLLLEHGADPNAANRAGATALMRAAGDVDKVRALLKHGAKVNARSAAGNTALIIACRQHGAAEIVKELLTQGADVHAATTSGMNALLAAAETGDEDVMRILIAHGAKVNSAARMPYSPALESALMIAANYGHDGCVELLLEHGADAAFTSDYGNALHFAAMKNRLGIARRLIERGANVNLPARRIGSFRNDFGLTPLMYAAMTEENDPALVQLLIDRGARVDAKTPAGETAFTLARQRGETRVVAALKAAGIDAAASPAPAPKLTARWTNVQIEKPDPALFRTAAERGLDALLQSSVRFNAATANRCVTCHQHSLPAVAQELARGKQFRYDDAVAAELLKSTVRTVARRVDHALEEPLPVPSIAAWLLIGLHASGHPADGLTDGYAYSLARTQFSDGRWITKAARAPTDYSDITSTALAVRALQLYSPPTMRKQFQRRIDRAATWLRGARAFSTEERALQLLGLHWAANSNETELKRLAAELRREQRENGGWAQLPTLDSDAYATGLALYALSQVGGVVASDAAYHQGVRFLLKEQREDGSWFVETRASPVQVAIDDVFAHDKHQWISSSATSWSTMALMLGSADSN